MLTINWKKKETWSFILAILIILLLIINLGISIYLIVSAKTPIPEQFCNCFGPQYDGVEANPEHAKYYGGYCYNKENITKLYDDGVFEKQFPGV
jgi:hypothetical protein